MALVPHPFDALLGLQQALETFQSSGWLEPSLSGSGAYPPLNAFRKGDDYIIIIELPGVKKSEIDVQLKHNTIRISGIKTVNYGEKAGVHRRERLAGKFDRALRLPVEIEPDNVKAEYRDGILALFLPRSATDKPKSITVN
jgi:HSP20 family protein